MKTSKLITISAICILALAYVSCSDAWLDEKPSKSLVIPTRIEDLQAILDNTDRFNLGHAIYGEASSDNYLVTQDAWSAAPELLRNSYIWAKELYGGTTTNEDWSKPYVRILHANIVLQGVDEIESSSGVTPASREIRGSALFMRALDYYNLSQIFCKPYIEATASSDLGLPLRLDPDINKQYKRSSLKEVYDLVLTDLENAVSLLPENTLYKTRPSRCATYALLSRIYLSMRKYEEALINSEKALAMYDILLDYNEINPNVMYPLERFNDEVIFHYELSLASFLIQTRFNVDTVLYDLFEGDDLRKQIFFNTVGQEIKYKGSYSGGYPFFGGLATDELYLTQAECQARLGSIDDAHTTISTLLEHRYRTGTYADPAVTDANSLLDYILQERRKELIFRGLRWTDLRRLNQEPTHATTLTRIMNGETYHLEPNSPEYVLTIPPDEMALSDLEQNSR